MTRQITLLLLCCALASLTAAHRATAQGTVANTQLRPFVTGIIPVVSGDGDFVGGVHVDAKGVVSRAETDESSSSSLPEFLHGDSRAKLRIVSLKNLEKAFRDYVVKNEPVPEDLLYLAGMQRVEYVVAMPESHDIILAGRGENWRVTADGSAVGVTTGRPTLRLDDLLEAFRTVELAAEGRGISCSIDPSEEGLERLQRLLSTRDLKFNTRTTQAMKRAIGPQNISITGVLPDSHFARVMVSADYLMKRLAMGLEASPLEDMPSYMELLKSDAGALNEIASPRWWMTVNYAPLLRSADGLSWQIRGPGVKVLTEDAFVDAAGVRVATSETDELAERWAQTMTDRYDELSRSMPIFGELRNCIDLSVVAAIITNYRLKDRVGNEFPLLSGRERIRGPQYPVATTVESHISALRAGNGWIVAVSGGVDLDSWSVLEKPEQGNVAVSIGQTPQQQWWWE